MLSTAPPSSVAFFHPSPGHLPTCTLTTAHTPNRTASHTLPRLAPVARYLTPSAAWSCSPLRYPTTTARYSRRSVLRLSAAASPSASQSSDGFLPPGPAPDLLPEGVQFNDQLRLLLKPTAITREQFLRARATKLDDASELSKAVQDEMVHMQQPKGTIKRLWDFIARAAKDDATIRWRLVLSILVMVASKLLNIATPWLFKRGLDALGTGPNQRDVSVVVKFLIAFGMSRVAASLLHESRNAVFAKAGQSLGRMVTKYSFTNLQNQDTAFHAKKKTGTVVGIVDRGNRSILSIFRSCLFSFAPSLLELVLVCVVLVRSFNATFMAVTMSTFLAFVALTLFMNNKMALTRRLMNSIEREGNAKLTDSFYNIESVKYFGNEKLELLRYDECLKAYQGEAIRNDYEYMCLNFLQGAIFTVGLTCSMVLAAHGVSRGVMTVGDLVMASTLLQQLWVPLSFLGWTWREAKQSMIHMEDLFNLLEAPAGIVDSPNAKPLRISGGGIEFKNVSFKYSPELEPVIKNISFTVPAGKMLAIVGESGSGKSTSLKLLYRLYEPTSGSILIDGKDIKEVTQESLRRAIGLIPQDTALFNDSISYNIAYGKPDASREEIIQAAKVAAIHDTIAKMPQGYDTVVGDKGIRLSGGERQRVAIARCVLKSPDILVCDEATSALDSRTEEEITSSLQAVQKERTSIVIAHRLSTVVDADIILVMRNGYIIEKGAHADLLEDSESEYSQMWARQQQDRVRPDGASDPGLSAVYDDPEETQLTMAEAGLPMRPPVVKHVENVSSETESEDWAFDDHSVEAPAVEEYARYVEDKLQQSSKD